MSDSKKSVSLEELVEKAAAYKFEAGLYERYETNENEKKYLNRLYDVFELFETSLSEIIASSKQKSEVRKRE